MISGATYAGTSDVFAAYLPGASIGWWDSDVQHPSQTPNNAFVSPITETMQGKCGEEPAGPALATRAEAPEENTGEEALPETVSGRQPVSTDQRSTTVNLAESPGVAVFDKYHKPVMKKMLKPFFFASMSFSIPITRRFIGSVFWRGLVYTILMLLGKAFTGLWLVRFQSPSRSFKRNLTPISHNSSTAEYEKMMSKQEHALERPTTHPNDTAFKWSA